MNYPKHKEIYRTVKCNQLNNTNVICTETYEYIPEKNVYRLISSSCSGSQKCSGITSYGLPCFRISSRPTEISPESPQLAVQSPPIY